MLFTILVKFYYFLHLKIVDFQCLQNEVLRPRKLSKSMILTHRKFLIFECYVSSGVKNHRFLTASANILDIQSDLASA